MLNHNQNLLILSYIIDQQFSSEEKIYTLMFLFIFINKYQVIFHNKLSFKFKFE